MHRFFHAFGTACVISACFAARGNAIQLSTPKSVMSEDPKAISEPQIIAPQIQPLPQNTCKKARHASIAAAVTINESGLPQGVYLVSASGTMADQLAFQTVLNDRFIPAHHSGRPVSTERVIQLELDTCTGKLDQGNGDRREATWLQVPPAQTLRPIDAGEPQGANHSELYRVGGNISAPVPVVNPEANYSEEARRARLEGDCYVTVIVDASGTPRNPRVVRPLGKGLDEKAVEAVMQYRFRPALKGGSKPVPVMITIAVNFHL